MLLYLIVLALVLFGISHRVWKGTIRSGISPTGLYALVWGTIWFVHWADVMYYRPVSDRGLIYSAVPLVAIFIAEFLALTASGPIRPKVCVFRRDALRRWALLCGMLTLFAGAVTIAASWMTFGNVISHAQELYVSRTQSGGMSLYSGTPLAFPAKYSSILLGASLPAVILGTLYLRLVGRKGWTLVALPLGAVVLYDLGSGSRVNIFNVLLLFIMVNIFLPLPHSAGEWKRIARKFGGKVKKSGKLFAVLVLAGGIFTMNIIGNTTRQYKTVFAGDLELAMSVVQVIDYNAGTLIGFDSTLDETAKNPTWGRMSFWGFEQWLRLLRIVPRSVPVPKQLAEWERQYIAYRADLNWARSGNVFTWLRYLYSDFGVFGLFIIPFLVGWSATWAAIFGVSRTRGLPGIAFVGVFYFVLLTSGTLIPFRLESYVFGVFILYFAVRQIVRPARTLRTSPITEKQEGAAGQSRVRNEKQRRKSDGSVIRFE